MSQRSTRSDAIAEALRADPPVLDDVAKARLERRLLQPRAVRTEPIRRRGAALAIAGAVALAAAALLLVLGRGTDAPPVARFERRAVESSVERGTLEAGSTLRTAVGEEAELSVGSSHVRLGEDSRLQLVTLRPDHVALQLEAGRVRVAFHPVERGRERLSVETPRARVEVVGTVFEVVARDDATTVRVTEGTVRVVPADGSPARLVQAGQETRVGDPLAAVSPVQPPASEPALAEPAAAAEPAPPSAPVVPAVRPSEVSESPTQRLTEARTLVEEGRTEAAIPVLRPLTRATTPAAVRAEAWMLLADIHRSASRLDDERQAYEQAAEAGRGRPAGHNALFSLARLQERRLGDRAAARITYERYLSEAPDGALARQAEDALCRLGASERCRGGR
jgi:ferric-dicitrate binding protein FerR (iron transport regulator)